MEFSFKQSQKRSESSSKAAEVLPQLIIEQFSSENIRTIPEKEKLERKLKELQTARLSLFLQLSKEYKTRDSLVLTQMKPRALTKEIKKEMEKIRDIEIKIDENLEEVRTTFDEFLPRIQHEEKEAERKAGGEGDKKNGPFPFQLPFPFFHKNEENQIVTENVVIYKNDSTALYKPSEKALEAGFTSWDFEQELLNAKINGLITGEITCYGDYCAVNVELRIYPGGQVLGRAREVGLLSDLMPLASSIARSLDSKIANALPVLLEFNIEPKGIAKNSKVMIDGIVFPLTKTDGSFDNKIIKDSGIHHITIGAAGYEDLSFSYSFTEDNHYYIHANLVPEVHGVAHIRLKKFRDGIFHTYGLNQAPVTKEEPLAKLNVNGKSILGVFTVPKLNEDDSDSSNIAFFRIPESQAFDGAYLLVNAKTFDREAYIDKRRRWMYTAYSALICSLPFTFYYVGEFTAENLSYSQGRGDYERLLKLQDKSNACIGLSAALGGWSIIELIRYLWAADRVLPAKTKLDRKTMKNPDWFKNTRLKTDESESQDNESPALKTESEKEGKSEATENESSDTIKNNESESNLVK